MSSLLNDIHISDASQNVCSVTLRMSVIFPGGATRAPASERLLLMFPQQEYCDRKSEFDDAEKLCMHRTEELSVIGSY